MMNEIHISKAIFFLLIAFAGVILPACSQKEEVVQLEPLPAIIWHERHITPFLTKDAWNGQEMDWDTVTTPLQTQIKMPEALETKLQHDDREIWRNVLAEVESYGQWRRDAVVYSNTKPSVAVQCEPNSAAFSLHQRATVQRTLQLHRNVLWRLGRLEMASRYVRASMKQFLTQYAGGRIKDADKFVVEPIRQMFEQIESIQSRYQKPNGIWAPGELHFRMARLSQTAPIFLQAKSAISLWNEKMLASSRWQYLSSTGLEVQDALGIWVKEYEALIASFHYLAAGIQTLEQSFAPPNNFVTYPCLNQNLKRLRIVSSLFDVVLPMQWALVKAENEASRVRDRIQTQNNHAFLLGEIDRASDELSAQLSKHARVADLLLMLWDETAYRFWNGIPVFIDPIHSRISTAVESADTWKILYQDIKSSIHSTASPLQAEPIQPLDKHGKPHQAPIIKILEGLRSPSRIDEVEHGLLAISELEAHMVSVRDELLRLCRDGACKSFPEAELARSPRTSSWVVSWRQSPVAERTLGHSLIVLKMSQLHLSRLVQRLTEIYAWFAETSNADISWKALKSWQRIWTLYAEPNGTYSNFLRSVSTLDSQIKDMAKPKQNRAESETLLELLRLQTQLFELTIDYARFLDDKVHPPVPFDDIMSTWEEIETALTTIAELTETRDNKLLPEDQQVKKKVRRDIDR